jgi:hypothetical protein
MHRLIRSNSLKHLLACEAPALVIALVVAELFYKFGSFTLECLAFLATWFLLSFLVERLGTWAGLIDAKS